MGRKGEKKVIVWKYQKDKASIDVPVYIVNSDGIGRNYDEPKTFFRVKMADPDIDLENANIDDLKKQVWEELNAKLSIQWRDFLHVIVSGDVDTIVAVPDPDDEPSDPVERITRSGECDVHLKYERVQLGELGGKKMHRMFNDCYDGVAHYGSAYDDWPKAGEGEKTRWSKSTDMQCLVPDTAENRAALDAIALGFDVLLKRLHSVLSPDVVESTLANVQTLKLLSA